jgi:hypothetical protein
MYQKINILLELKVGDQIKIQTKTQKFKQNLEKNQTKIV